MWTDPEWWSYLFYSWTLVDWNALFSQWLLEPIQPMDGMDPIRPMGEMDPIRPGGGIG